MVEVGSMEVVGVYKDIGIHRGLQQTHDDLENATQSSMSLKEEMIRLNKVVALIGLTAAGFGLKMKSAFMNAVMSSPYLIGALTKIKTYTELLGWAVTRHLQPALEWLGSGIKKVYEWYKSLSDETQELIMWSVILGTSILILTGSVVGLAFALKGLGFGSLLTSLSGVVTWLGGLVTSFVASTAGVVAFSAAVGVALGLLGVWIMDKIGFLDWVSDLGTGFRAARDSGNLLAHAITAILGPFALLGDLFLILVTDRTMEDFSRDVDMVTNSFNALGNSMGSLRNKDGSFKIGRDMPGSGSWAVGTAVVPADGMYKLHAGESVAPSNSSQATSQQSSIVLDFSGANINLANGIDLDRFADVVSRKIADTQAWGAY